MGKAENIIIPQIIMDHLSDWIKKKLDMKEKNNFIFFSQPPWNDKKVFRVLIPCSVNSKNKLLKFYASLFQIGGYFGHNWDALNDVMTDLDWIQEEKIEILHDGIPNLTTNELKIYLEILNNAVRFWNLQRPKGKHDLSIYFPNEVENRIIELTSN